MKLAVCRRSKDAFKGKYIFWANPYLESDFDIIRREIY